MAFGPPAPAPVASVIVDVSPRRLQATPGIPQQVQVTITNTGDLIAGYAVRLLGADPSWVELADDDISLFPDEVRTVEATITVPPGINAGEQRIAVQVRELTPPEASSIDDVVLDVPAAESLSMRVDPMAITAGRTARFSMLVENSGNTTVEGQVLGRDPEGRVRFRFQPPTLSLAPGEHGVVDVRASARQPFAGAPLLRVLTLGVGDPGPEPVPAEATDPAVAATPPADRPTAPARPALPARPAMLSAQPPSELAAVRTLPSHRLPSPAARLRARRRPAAIRPIPDDVPVTHATFVQKALLTRGPLSLLGLLVAVTVFAVVITVALSRLVGQSAADRNLALEIASARDDASAVAGSGNAVGGTVRLLTSGTGVPGVAVAVYAADETSAPVSTTATDDAGAWRVGELPAGDYKVTFRGAGFVQLWYPQAVDASNAETVTIASGTDQLGLDVALGGVPATVAGTVVGEDVSGATLTLRTPLDAAAAATAATTTSVAEQGAQVMSVPVGSDGTFTLTDVPSPSVYDLVVTKQGYATTSQRIDVAAGEERAGVELSLREGDGLISGVISAGDGPVGGATITATSGTTTVTTQSVTEGDVGSFTLRGLPTPASFTVVASLPDFASQTLTLSLADGQRLTGVALTLGKASGTLAGDVTVAPEDAAGEGVVVTVTDGAQTVRTATQSTDQAPRSRPGSRQPAGRAGSWSVSGLAIPGTYTVTFSRNDLSPQTLSVVLDSAGNVTSGATGTGARAGRIDVTMQPSTAVLEGQVTQRLGTGGTQPAGEVLVTLTSGAATYTATTASVPAASAGRYRIEGIPPGTYTVSTSRSGVTPSSTILELSAGEVRSYPVELAAAASIRGVVVREDGTPVPAGWVVELFRSADYPADVYLTTTTAADGSFLFPDVDAPEAYVVQVRRTRVAAPSGTRTLQINGSQALQTTVTTSP